MDTIKTSFIGLAALVLSGCGNLSRIPKSPNPYSPSALEHLPIQPEIQIDVNKELELKVSEEKPSPEKKPEIDLSIPRYFQTLTPELKALLDTISYAEYTSPPCRGEISSYQILVIGKHIEDPNRRYGGRFGNWDPKPNPDEDTCRGQYFIGWEDHPRIRVRWHKGYRASEAAGRYQWMEKTYDDLRNKNDCGSAKDEDCGLFKTGIWPDEQDKAAIFLTEELGVTQKVLEAAISDGSFKRVWKKMARTWASLPYHNWRGRGIGFYKSQRNAKSFKDLKQVYMDAYNKYKKEEMDVVDLFFSPTNPADTFLLQDNHLFYRPRLRTGECFQFLDR